MTYRTRINYSPKQKSEMWDRWQRGESLSSIGRSFNRESSSVFLGYYRELAVFDQHLENDLV